MGRSGSTSARSTLPVPNGIHWSPCCWYVGAATCAKLTEKQTTRGLRARLRSCYGTAESETSHWIRFTERGCRHECTTGG